MKLSSDNKAELRPKKANKLFLLIKNVLDRIFNKKFLTSFLIVFATAFLGRYIILTTYDVNVFTDISSVISFCYYAFMVGFQFLIRQYISELMDGSLMLDGAGSSGAEKAEATTPLTGSGHP